MNIKEQLIKKQEVSGNSVVMIFGIEGMFYVKRIVNGVAQFSDCVQKHAAERIFESSMFNLNCDLK